MITCAVSNNPGTTTYYVSQTLTNQCESPRVAITVTVYALPSAPTITSSVQLCKGVTAKPLTATGSNLLWYTTANGGTGSTTAPTPSTTNVGTTYYYVSQTTNGCEGQRATIEVIISEIPSAPTVTSPVNYCQNQKADPLTANGTGLLWYTSATGGTGSSIAPIPPTSTPVKTLYYVSQSNYCGESPRATIEVDVFAGPGTGFPVNSANASISPVKIEDGGVYSITVTSPQTGCSVTADTLIQVGGYPVVKFSKDSFNLPTGYMMNLTPAIINASDKNILPIAKYEWTPSDNVQCNDAPCSLPTITVKKNICYAVKATNIYGCSGSDTICISTFCNNAQVFIPNAFIPKGAFANSKFMIRASGIASVKSFRVFNRWGRIVFEKNNFPPNDPAYAWDGYVNGKLADMVYMFTQLTLYAKTERLTLIKGM